MIAAKSTSMAIRARPLATTPGAAHGEVLAAAAGMKASGSNSAPMAATSGIYFPICSAAAVVAGVAARLAAPRNGLFASVEERRVGQEGVSTCGSRWSAYHSKKNKYIH